MMFQRWLSLLGLIIGGFGQQTAVAQPLPEPALPVVQAILFFSPTCPHCHDVIINVLPPLTEQYGDQLQIVGLDVSNELGQYLYQTAVTQFKIPDARLGVPTLIVGDVVLVGSLEIQEQFPTLIEDGLAVGGIAWPALPALREIMPDLPADSVPVEPTTAPEIIPLAPAATAVPAESDTAILPLEKIEIEQAAESIAAKPPADPVGFALGWTVLLALVAGLAYGLWTWVKKRPFTRRPQAQSSPNNKQTAVILGLVILGLGVAGYLAYVETAQVTAVCGPIGECNLVQSSPYARLFGIPVALFGVLSYLAIGVLWLLRQATDGKAAGLTGYGLLALTLLGTLFSAYLTMLELLVIHAICAWCLSSALITLSLFLIVIRWLPQRPFLQTPGFEASI